MLQNLVDIAAGERHSLGLRSDGIHAGIERTRDEPKSAIADYNSKRAALPRIIVPSNRKLLTATLRLHAILPRSCANGPGIRTVIWLQGCQRNCAGCFNPATHPLDTGFLISLRLLWQRIKPYEVEGVTISGGEPLLQMVPLVEFLHRIKSESALSVILYTGYTIEEVKQMNLGDELLSLVDVLIDGPYDCTRPAKDGIRGSDNQRIHFLSGTYNERDFATAERQEIIIQPDGTLVRTGVWTTNLSESDVPSLIS